jgi:hypothetical protein
LRLTAPPEVVAKLLVVVAELLSHGDRRLVDSTMAICALEADINESLTLDPLRQYPSTCLDSAGEQAALTSSLAEAPVMT